MITLGAELEVALARTPVKSFVLVTIEAGANTYRAAFGHYCDEGAGYGTCSSSVVDIKPVSTEVDPIGRTMKVSELTVAFAADGFIRDIVVAERLRGRKLSCVLGFEGVDHAQWPTLFVGVISEVRPFADGSAELTCMSQFGRLAEVDLLGYWIGKHPLDAAREVLIAGGIPESLIGSTVDSAHVNNAAIRHWNLSRGGLPENFGTLDKSIKMPTKAKELFEGIAKLLPGVFVVRDSGVIDYVHYDSAQSASVTWSDDDLVGELDFDEYDANLVNRMYVEFASEETLKLDDAASQAAHAYPGETEYVRSDTLQLDWVDAVANLQRNPLSAITAGSPGVGGTFTVYGKRLYSFCGARWPGCPLELPPGNAILDDTHTAYLRIDDEIIEVDRCTVSPNDTIGGSLWYLFGYVPFRVPGKAVFRVKARGALGTTAAAHLRHEPAETEGDDPIPNTVADATIPAANAQYLLKRLHNGMPIVKATTTYAKIGTEVGDVIALDTARVYGYGEADASHYLWQVVSKELQVGDEPCINWTLALHVNTEESVPTISVLPINMWKDKVASAGAMAAMTFKDMATGHILGASAFGVTHSGLVATISAGKITTGMSALGLRTTHDIDLVASSDNYLILDLSTQAVTLRAVAIGATPDVNHGEIVVHKLRTGASSVSTATDLRTAASIKGDKLTDLSVVTGKLGDLAVTAGKIGALAVTEGKLADLAVASGKIAAGAVVEAKLGDLAVTAGKIGALAVTEGKIGALAVTSGKLGAAAVVTSKLDAAAVAPISISSRIPIGSAMNLNPFFKFTTKG
jgi:hypothetical protein